MREHEARLLADSLRSSRLTLLHAGAGASRSALLAEGVVPLLARREADATVHAVRESRVVAPFVERRGVDDLGDDARERVERVVLVADWGPDPLAALVTAVLSALPGTLTTDEFGPVLADGLEALCERLDTRLLIVLDAFEEFWANSVDPDAAARFVDAFAEAVNRGHLRVNFLLAIDDRWEGRLDAFRRVVRGFDDSTVRLLGFDPGNTAVAARPIEVPRDRREPPPRPPTLSDAVPTAGSPPVVLPSTRSSRQRVPKAPMAPPVPIKTDSVYAFIESTLTQTADASVPWNDVDAVPAPSAPAPTSRERRPRAPARTDGAGSRSSRAAPDEPASMREPPSPIDDWLDTVIAWGRRVLRRR